MIRNDLHPMFEPEFEGSSGESFPFMQSPVNSPKPFTKFFVEFGFSKDHNFYEVRLT